VNYTSQFVGGWSKELFGVSTRIDIIFACLYWLNGKLFHRNLAGLLTQLLNKRTVPELDRHKLLFGCVLLHPERFPDRNSGYLAGKAVQPFDRSRDYTDDSLGFRFDDGLNCSSARRRWIAFHN